MSVIVSESRPLVRCGLIKRQLIRRAATAAAPFTTASKAPPGTAFDGPNAAKTIRRAEEA